MDMIGVVLSILVAVPAGVAAAAFQGSWFDRALMALAVAGFSITVFVIGYLLAWIFLSNSAGFPFKAIRHYPQVLFPFSPI